MLRDEAVQALDGNGYVLAIPEDPLVDHLRSVGIIRKSQVDHHWFEKIEQTRRSYDRRLQCPPLKCARVRGFGILDGVAIVRAAHLDESVRGVPQKLQLGLAEAVFEVTEKLLDIRSVFRAVHKARCPWLST